MSTMEKRVFSRINPYVRAGCSVHCSSCASEVKPAMSIERGYAVEAVSLVEPLNHTNGPKETETPLLWNNNRIADKAKVNGETEAKSILPIEIVEVDDDKAKAASQVNDAREDDTSEDPDVEDDSDTLSDETVVQKNSSENETAVQKSSDGDESEHLNEDLDQSDGEETDWKDADTVQEIYVVSPSKYKGINLALDKARFCLQKTNSTTLKRAQELSQEGIAHIEAIKKLVEENIPREGSTLVDDLSFISKELFENLKALKYKMLDCQLESLLDIVEILKKDLETELASLDEMEQPEKVIPNDFEIATPATDPLMTFLKDSPWVFFGFISILGANLGYFSQPWLFHSFHTTFMKFSGYLNNATFY